MTSLTTASASDPVKSCMAFSVDSTLLAAANSCARCRFSAGLCKNVFFAPSLLKQYVLPSLSVQVVVQLVITCWPSASPWAHCPPNCGAGGEAGASAAPAPVSMAGNTARAVHKTAADVLRRQTNQNPNAWYRAMRFPPNAPCISPLTLEVDVRRRVAPRHRGARTGVPADIRAPRDPNLRSERPPRTYSAESRVRLPPGRRRCGRHRKAVKTRRAPR